MSEPGSANPEAVAELIHGVLDLMVNAPIGFVLDAQDIVPDTARRGHQHRKAGRLIGELAVTAGLAKLAERAELEP